jgi:rare lipoprotein A
VQQYDSICDSRVARGSAHGWAVLGFAAAICVAAPAGGERVRVDAHTEQVAKADRAPEWTQNGRVSWYGPGFHGRRTANGEVFDTNELTMAHRTLPFGTEVRVTNLANGRSVVLRVNDRGPYVRGRIADLSHAAATRLGFVDDGVTKARIEMI